MPSNSIEKEIHQQKQIQLKLSTIFKQKVIDTPQCFGTFYDADGGKYWAISVLSKYLGYDLAGAAAAILSKIHDGKNPNPADSCSNRQLVRKQRNVIDNWVWRN